MADLRRRSVCAADSDAVIYERLAPELIRFAHTLVGRSDAADVLSEAVVRSLASTNWSNVADRRAYLYRAVVSVASNHRRRAASQRRRDARLAPPDDRELPNVRPDVRRAVLGLSVRQRAVIVLTYWADLTPTSIGDLLGVSEGSVRRHLARARAHLREVLHD